MKKIFVILFLILGTVPLQSQNDFAMAGTVPNDRYISLAPATTEILFALGLDEEITGVSSYCNYPKATESKEKIGTFSEPNIEKILSLKPDYVFCTGLEQAKIVGELRRLGVKTFVSDPKNINELMDSIRDIGKLTNREKEALAITDDMKDKINKMTVKVKSIPEGRKQKVFIEIWNDPLMTAGKFTFIDELITLAGGINIAHNTPRPYCYYSPEQVIKSNPDCIILAYMTKDKPDSILKSRLGWHQVNAVKNGRVFSDINPDTLLRATPRLVTGLEELYKKLYPEKNENRIEN